MKKLRRYFYLLFLCCCLLPAAAQKENNIWYFGAYAGLNFSVSPPAVLTNGTLTTMEGCASIADANGSLLFYTDGSTIFTAQHTVMANGNGLNGHSSTTQAAVIVRQPLSSTIYYVFSLGVSGNGALNYSTVDMSLANGSGSVVAKNTTLAAAPLSEKMTSVKHCNGLDVWVITHESGTNNFLAFLVTSGGVALNPIISSAGSTYTQTAFCGNMKASPNGSKIGVAIQSPVNSFELFDFNSASGMVSNFLSLGSFVNAYGCEFSPDGTKFYGSREYGTGSMALFQWDLCAGNNTAIIASQYSIATSSNIYGMQLATDGKIYIARFGSTLAVVHNPNASGSACSYTHNGLSIAPKTCNFNLPNFVTSGFKAPTPPFTFTVSNSFGCQAAAFTSPSLTSNSTSSTCMAGGYSVTSITWNFGDPASGSANTSTLTNPIHAFHTLGTYTVGMVVNYACGGGMDTVKQVVIINQPCISVTSTSITCATLGSATVQATGGIGPFSYTWMPSNQSGSVATGLSPGTYTLTVFDYGNNFTYTALTVFNSLIPLTGDIVFQPSVACYGASNATASVINLAGGSGNTLYQWSSGSLTYTAHTPTTMSSGLWSVTVTDALTGCQVKDIFYITQPPQLTVQLSSTSPSACVGHTVGLSGLAGGGTPGYTYQFSGGPALPNYTATSNVAGTATFVLNATDTLGCQTSTPVYVIFVPNPPVTVGNQNICPLETATLMANGATSYTWMGNITGNSFTVSPSTATQYSVVGSAQGCTNVAYATVQFKPLPVPMISSNSPTCETGSLNLFAAGGSGYVWSGPLSYSATGASASRSPLTNAHGGVYQVTVTAANSCTATAATTVVVHPSPTVSAAGSTVCTTQTLALLVTSVPGATFLWSGPLGFNSTQSHATIPSPVLAAGGNYSVIATSPQTCTNLAVVHGGVVSPPSLMLSPTSRTFCAQPFGDSPASVTLNVSGATSYTLSATQNLNAMGTFPVYHLGALPPFSQALSLASVTLTGSNGVCTSTAATDFTIIPNPVVQIVSPNRVICAGETFTFGAAGATSYTWSSSSSFGTFPGGLNIVTQPQITSSYSVEGHHLGCVSDMVSEQLVVNPIPDIFVDPKNTRICLNNTATLQATGTATDYEWEPAFFLKGNKGAVVYASPPADQDFTVTGTALNCTNQAVAKVTVLALPVPTATASDNEICLNESVTLFGSGGVSYRWFGPQNLNFGGSPFSFVVSHMAYAGEYTLVATDSNFCSGRTTISINVNPLPEGDLVSSRMADCIPFCQDFEFSSQQPSVALQAWFVYKPQSGQPLKINAEEFSYCFKSPGTYTISGQFTDLETSCRSLQMFEVDAFERPLAGFEWAPAKPVELQDEVTLQNTSLGAGQQRWTWYFAHDNKMTVEKQQTSYLFREAGKYPVAMVVENSWGCRDTAINVIEVLPDFAFYMPNAFTPNADSRNETLKPVMRSVREDSYYFQVFNRWGERLFVTRNPLEGWDGTYQGEPCKQDNYVWVIEVHTGVEGKKYNGTVLLYR